MRYTPPSPTKLSRILRRVYDTLYAAYGPQSWWPADTPFEVMVGAVLTQNTSWANVEKAIDGLKGAVEMTPAAILSVPVDHLEALIRSSGYFRQKAERLRTLCNFIIRKYKGELSLMLRSSTRELRQQFLALNGIGPETADSMLLYSLQRPVFVIDAYTVRLFSRLGLCGEKTKYHDLQSLFMDNMEPEPGIFNEYHALIVRHCKLTCKKREPRCGECALVKLCAFNLKFHISNLR